MLGSTLIYPVYLNYAERPSASGGVVEYKRRRFRRYEHSAGEYRQDRR
jgi:hypothetical protein